MSGRSFVARNDTALIGERTATCGRIATGGGAQREKCTSLAPGTMRRSSTNAPHHGRIVTEGDDERLRESGAIRMASAAECRER